MTAMFTGQGSTQLQSRLGEQCLLLLQPVAKEKEHSEVWEAATRLGNFLEAVAPPILHGSQLDVIEASQRRESYCPAHLLLMQATDRSARAEMASLSLDCGSPSPHDPSLKDLALGLQLPQQVGPRQAGSSATWGRLLRVRLLQGTAATAL